VAKAFRQRSHPVAAIQRSLIFLLRCCLAAYDLTATQSRRIHQWAGGVLVLSVVVHVAGLWITSPPDVIDALLFSSPTPFSVWGVIAMWGIFAAAAMVMFRRKVKVRLAVWRLIHKALAVVIVAGSVIHAMQIEGTMETLSKTALCIMVSVALVTAIIYRVRR